MKNKVLVDIRWNNSCCRSKCPISGDLFKPFIGMYPFQSGTFDPISLDALAESDSRSVELILELSHIYMQLKNEGSEIPEIIQMVVEF